MLCPSEVLASFYNFNRDPSTPLVTQLGYHISPRAKNPKKTLYARTNTNLRQSADDNDNNTNDGLWIVTDPSKVSY
jgi:hypothetical protein